MSAVAASANGLSVFVAGAFNVVDGVSRNRLAKLTLATGQLDPAFHAAVTGTSVDALAVKAPNLYLGGAFSAIDGAARGRFAAVNLASGAVNANVAVNFTTKRRGTLRVAHMAINPAGTRLLATGTFTQVNGLDRQPDRDAQPDDAQGDDRPVADEPVQARLRPTVRHIHPRRRLLARRQLLRGRGHRRLLRRPGHGDAVRQRVALAGDRDRHRAPARLDRLHRR